jgi:hypothetical protein
MLCEEVEVQIHMCLTSELETSGHLQYQVSEFRLMNLAVPQPWSQRRRENSVSVPGIEGDAFGP